MSDILQRMIERSREPLSAIEPILPSVFAPGQSSETATGIEVMTATSAPTPDARPELSIPRTIAAEAGVRPIPAEDGATLLAQQTVGRASKAHQESDARPGQAPVNSSTNEIVDAMQSFDRAKSGTLPVSTPEPRQFTRSDASLHLPRPTVEKKPSAKPVKPAPEPLHSQPIPQGSPMSREIAASVQPAAVKTEVFISIDQVEVRATPPVQTPRAPAQKPMMSLQEYLQRRRDA